MTAANTSLAVALALAATTMLAGVQTGSSTAAPGVTAPLPPDVVTVVDTSFPPVTLDAARVVHGTVFVANPARFTRTVSIAISVRTVSGRSFDLSPVTIVPSVNGARPANEVPESTALHAIPFTATLPSSLAPEEFPLTGWLAVTTPASSTDPKSVEGAPRGKTIEIKGILARNTGHDWWILETALLVALAATLVGAFAAVIRDGLGVLFHRMGGPTWSFADSWSSTLTVAGTMFTAVVGFAGLPEQGHFLNKRTYAILSLALTGLIGLAPGIYNVFRKPVEHTVGGVTTVQYQGFVALFLLAALFTMTGVVAQLGVLRALFTDIAAANVVSAETADAFRKLFRGMQGLLVLYAAVSIAQTLHAQSAPPAWKTGAAARRPAALAQRLPDWPLL